jgi:hypothetical protein
MALPYATTNQVEKKVKESTDELIKKLESGEIVIPGGGSSGLEPLSVDNPILDESFGWTEEQIVQFISDNDITDEPKLYDFCASELNKTFIVLVGGHYTSAENFSLHIGFFGSASGELALVLDEGDWGDGLYHFVGDPTPSITATPLQFIDLDLIADGNEPECRKLHNLPTDYIDESAPYVILILQNPDTETLAILDAIFTPYDDEWTFVTSYGMIIVTYDRDRGSYVLDLGRFTFPGGSGAGLEEIPLASIENNILDDSAIEHLRTLARNHSNVILIINNEWAQEDGSSFYPLLAKLQWFQESSWEKITFITSLGNIGMTVYQGSD